MKKFGFTLAEVLITLGIIGVVAAITMPTLIKNYQKQATVNKIKKFYTNINQVYLRAQVDNGEYSTWSYDDVEDYYNKYLKPYLKNVDNIQKNTGILGLISAGNAIRVVFADGTQAIFAIRSEHVMKNNGGAVILFDTKVQKHNSGISSYIKYPTRERFTFIINNKGVVTLPGLSDTREQNLRKCKKYNPNNGNNYGNNGYVTCSTVIYKDGWKIAPDYPW